MMPLSLSYVTRIIMFFLVFFLTVSIAVDVANAVVAVVTDFVVSVSDAIALCVVIGTAEISCVITAKIVIDVAYDTVVTCIAVRCMDC